jgi:hypothetical protein
MGSPQRTAVLGHNGLTPAHVCAGTLTARLADIGATTARAHPTPTSAPAQQWAHPRGGCVVLRSAEVRRPEGRLLFREGQGGCRVPPRRQAGAGLHGSTQSTPSEYRGPAAGLHGSTQSTPLEYRGPAASCRQRSSDADGRSPSSSFFGSTELAPANRVPKAGWF